MGQKVLINLAILAVIWVTLTFLSPRFLTPENLTNVFRQIATVATVGSVVTMLMVSRNFDLSVGGVLALSGCVVYDPYPEEEYGTADGYGEYYEPGPVYCEPDPVYCESAPVYCESAPVYCEPAPAYCDSDGPPRGYRRGPDHERHEGPDDRDDYRGHGDGPREDRGGGEDRGNGYRRGR